MKAPFCKLCVGLTIEKFTGEYPVDLMGPEIPFFQQERDELRCKTTTPIERLYMGVIVYLRPSDILQQ